MYALWTFFQSVRNIGVLLAAFSAFLGISQSDSSVQERWSVMPSLSTKPVLITTIAVAGVVACFIATAVHLRPTNAAAAARRAQRTQMSQQPGALQAVQQPSSGSSAPACVASTNPRVSAETLSNLQTRARELADQKQFADALPAFRNIAAVDPGFPGVNLDLSVSLLQVKRMQEAKAAVDAQLAVSDCLSKLPPDALQAYCKTEMPHTTPDSCREQLASIQKTAHFQAALVQMELGHTGDEPISAAEAVPLPRPRPKVSQTPHSLAASPAPHKAAAPRADREDSGDRALRAGSGTDDDLGFPKN